MTDHREQSYTQRRENALHIWAQSNLPSLRDLKVLLQNGVDPNAQDIQGFTPLMFLTQKEIVLTQTLLEHGANPFIKASHGTNAVSYAITLSCPRLLEVLLEKSNHPIQKEDLKFFIDQINSIDKNAKKTFKRCLNILKSIEEKFSLEEELANTGLSQNTLPKSYKI